jgi:hypothetical protein
MPRVPANERPKPASYMSASGEESKMPHQTKNNIAILDARLPHSSAI